MGKTQGYGTGCCKAVLLVVKIQVSEAKKKANKKWTEANYKRMNIALPKEEADIIHNYCKEKKISKNGFFREAAN